MDVYFPNLALVIGRSAEFGSVFERQRLEHDLNVAGKSVRLYTYDDLLMMGRMREVVSGSGLDQVGYDQRELC